MSQEIIIFWIFGIAVLAGGLLTVYTRNLIHAAAGLFLSLFAVAGIFVISGADFAGIVQLIVYVGGILILLLFGVMLTRRFSGEAARTGTQNVISGFLISGALAGCMIYMLLQGDYFTGPEGMQEFNTEGSTSGIGVQTLTQYILPFEAVSFLLLTALAGSAWIARRKAAEPRDILKSRKNDIHL